MLEEFRKSIKTDLKTIIKYLDPLDIYRRFTPTNYGIYLSCIFYILKLFHTLGHEICPNTLKNLDNLKYSFSDHSKIKLEINIIMNLENNSKFWKLKINTSVDCKNNRKVDYHDWIHPSFLSNGQIQQTKSVTACWATPSIKHM